MNENIASVAKVQEIEIDFFRSEDAPGVARLFHQVYGEGYPIRSYYLPELLRKENRAGRVISSVARTSTGEIIGHDALVLIDPAAKLYENAAGVMLPAFRRQGIFLRLMQHSLRDAAKHFGVEEIIGEPVCNHVQLQKMCLCLDYKESGLEVDLMPAAAYDKEQSAHGRVSVLLGYFLHKDKPQIVYLPTVYRSELEYIYEGMAVERTFGDLKSVLPAGGESHGNLDIFDLAKVARISVQHINSDFDAFIRRSENMACKRSAQIFQVWLPLTSPFATAATDLLRARGYFICGVLPNWLNTDVLLMQKVGDEPNWKGITLYSERAQRLGEIVRRDWKDVWRNHRGK